MSRAALNYASPAARQAAALTTISPAAAYLVILGGQVAVLSSILVDDTGYATLLLVGLFLVSLLVVYERLGTLTTRLMTIFAVPIGTIHATIPMEKAAGWRLIAPAFMFTDRPSTEVLALSVLCLALSVSLIVGAVRRRSLGPVLAFVATVAVLVIKTWYNLQIFSRYSPFQIVTDGVIITACVTLIAGTRPRDFDVAEFKRQFPALMLAMVGVAVIDGAGALLDLVPWATWSSDAGVRGGIQGILSGSEVYLSCYAGVGFLTLWCYARREHAVVFLALEAFLVWTIVKSNNTTALILALAVAAYMLLNWRWPRALIAFAWVGGIVAGLAGLYLYGRTLGIFAIDSTVIARIGTVVLAYPLWTNNLWLGAGSGIFDINQITNIAAAVFDHGYVSWLESLDLSNPVVHEFLNRASSSNYGYARGGEVNPHFGPAFILFSYGLVALPFIVAYAFVLPPLFLYRMVREPQPSIRLMAAVGFYLIAFSFLHPRVPAVEIIVAYLAVQAAARERAPRIAGAEIFADAP